MLHIISAQVCKVTGNALILSQCTLEIRIVLLALLFFLRPAFFSLVIVYALVTHSRRPTFCVTHHVLLFGVILHVILSNFLPDFSSYSNFLTDECIFFQIFKNLRMVSIIVVNSIQKKYSLCK